MKAAVMVLASAAFVALLIQALRPAALLCVNHVHGLAELCQAWGVALSAGAACEALRAGQLPAP